MTNPYAKSLPNLAALCWKCDGKGNLPHFSHIENGRCFACQGSGKCSIRQYTDGVFIHPNQMITFLLNGRTGSGLAMHDGHPVTATRDGGLMSKNRRDSLALIKGGLDMLKRGYGFGVDYDGNLTEERIPITPRDFVNDAIRLACLNDERANERAIVYVGDEAGERLKLALVGAKAALVECRKHADKMGWKYHPPQ
jgi:hypothetical protein